MLEMLGVLVLFLASVAPAWSQVADTVFLNGKIALNTTRHMETDFRLKAGE